MWRRWAAVLHPAKRCRCILHIVKKITITRLYSPATTRKPFSPLQIISEMERSQKKRSNLEHQSQGKVESFLQASFPPVCPQWTACRGRRNPAGGTATPSTAECWRGRRTRWTRKTRRPGSSTRSCSVWPCPNRGACRRRERVRGAHTSARSFTCFPTWLKFPNSEWNPDQSTFGNIWST